MQQQFNMNMGNNPKFYSVKKDRALPPESFNNDENKKTKFSNGENLFSVISLASQIGLMIVIPLVGFLLLGLYVDRKLNTLPIFLIFFVFLSFVILPFEFRYLLKPFLEKRS